MVVTGTRIEASGFTAPTPVRTLDSTYIQQRNPVDLGELLKDVPAVFVSGPTNSGAINSVSQSFVSLVLSGGQRSLRFRVRPAAT